MIGYQTAGVVSITRVFLLAILAAAIITLGGCESIPTSADGAPAFALKLRRATNDGKYTAFEIKRDGAFSFGGGREASRGDSKPIGKLTDQQRKRVWELVTSYKLDKAKSGAMFTTPKSVTYDFATGSQGIIPGRDIRVYDDDVPGMKELHDLLYDYQAAIRFNVPALQR